VTWVPATVCYWSGYGQNISLLWTGRTLHPVFHAPGGWDPSRTQASTPMNDLWGELRGYRHLKPRNIWKGRISRARWTPGRYLSDIARFTPEENSGWTSNTTRSSSVCVDKMHPAVWSEELSQEMIIGGLLVLRSVRKAVRADAGSRLVFLYAWIVYLSTRPRNRAAPYPNRRGPRGFTRAHPVRSADGYSYCPKLISDHWMEQADERDVRGAPCTWHGDRLADRHHFSELCERTHSFLLRWVRVIRFRWVNSAFRNRSKAFKVHRSNWPNPASRQLV